MPSETESSPHSLRRSADERMADLAVFTDGLVHDLRNPLNVIRTNVYLLRQRLTSEDARVTRAIDRIDDQVTGAMRLLDGVQAFYRADRPGMQQVNLNELVRGVADTANVPDTLEVSTDLAEGLPIATVDPQLVEAALRAMVRNAVEATGGAGTLRFVTCPGEGGIRLVVEDSGPGLDEEAKAKAFEPFYTTRRAQAGLGLALVEKVARAHSGRAEIRSEPGAPTQVILELPAGE